MVSPATTVIVEVADRPPASVAVIVAVPNPYAVMAMVPPVVGPSLATAPFEVVQLKVADGIEAFAESSPSATSVCFLPRVGVAAPGVMVTCVIGCAAATL